MFCRTCYYIILFVDIVYVPLCWKEVLLALDCSSSVIKRQNDDEDDSEIQTIFKLIAVDVNCVRTVCRLGTHL